MELTQLKKLKINSTNIKSFLMRSNKELIRLKKDRVKLFSTQQTKAKIFKKETSIESESSFKKSISNIGSRLVSGPLSLIDKFKEFFGLILLGILVNNLPKIITKFQEVFGKIKDFLDGNPWIVDAVKFGFKIIGEGIMGLVKFIKFVKPYIGGSFKFALDTIKVTKNQIGSLISTFDELNLAFGGLIKDLNADKIPDMNKDPAKYSEFIAGGGQSALDQRGQTVDEVVEQGKKNISGYDTIKKQSPSSQTQNRRRKSTNAPSSPVEKMSRGGTIRRKLGNIPPSEGTGRGGPSDIARTSSYLLERDSKYASPFARPGGTAKGRKAKESVNAFKVFEVNVKKEAFNLEDQEKNYNLFGEFLSSFEILSGLYEKFGFASSLVDPRLPTLTPNEILEYEVSGATLPSLYPGRGNRGLKGDHNYPARDYQIDVGKAISVFVPGTVVESGESGSGYGNQVVIKHDNGKFTQYAHLSKINVNKGDRIEEGKPVVIGLTGGAKGAPGSGNSTGPHLHFELRNQNGKSVTEYNDGDAFFRFGKVTSVRKRTVEELDKLINKDLVPTGQKEVGQASWYGPGFQGKRTAYGERFDTNTLTAASPPTNMGGLPYNTRVKVTNLANKKSVIVRINDTGPYAVNSQGKALRPLRRHPTRIIDLSKAAMDKIGGSGVINVELEVMKIDTSKKADAPERKITTSNLKSDISKIMNTLKLPSFTFGNYEVITKPNGELDVRYKGGNFGNILKGGLYSVFGGNVDVTGNNEKLLQQIKVKLEDVLNKKNKPGPSALDYGGSQSSGLTIVKETVVAMVPGPPQTVPVPVDRLVPVLVSTESNYNEAFYSV